jgi:hypothetical protein
LRATRVKRNGFSHAAQAIASRVGIAADVVKAAAEIDRRLTDRASARKTCRSEAMSAAVHTHFTPGRPDVTRGLVSILLVVILPL